MRCHRAVYRSIRNVSQEIVFQETAPCGCLHRGSTTVDERFWKLATAKYRTLQSVGTSLKHGLVGRWAAFKKGFHGGKGIIVSLKDCFAGSPPMYGVAGYDPRSSAWKVAASDVTQLFEPSVASTCATAVDMLHAASSAGAGVFHVLFAGGLGENSYFRAEVSCSHLTHDRTLSASQVERRLSASLPRRVSAVTFSRVPTPYYKSVAEGAVLHAYKNIILR